MNAVTDLQKSESFSLSPQSLEEAINFAKLMSQASIVPKDYQGNPGNILVAIQWGMELGLQPLQAMQNICVINGRPSIWGDAMLGLVRGSRMLEYIHEDIAETQATCTLKRRGEDEIVRTFTLEDAKRAGLAGKSGPWQQYPKRMLQMRARGYALRDAFPDVLRGIHIAEEARDMPVERDMGNVEIVPEVIQKKPASKTENLRDKVAAKHKHKAKPDNARLDEVLSAIIAAETLTVLDEIATLAAALETDEEKAKAREAWKQRKDALMHVDTETGEVVTQEFDGLQITYAEVAEKLQQATGQDDLDLAADLINSVIDAQQRIELSTIYADRLKDLAQ